MPNTPLNKEAIHTVLDSLTTYAIGVLMMRETGVYDQEEFKLLLEKYTNDALEIILADRNAAIREARDATHNLYKKEIAMYKKFQDMYIRNEQLKTENPLIVCAGCGKRLGLQSQPNAKDTTNEG